MRAVSVRGSNSAACHHRAGTRRRRRLDVAGSYRTRKIFSRAAAKMNRNRSSLAASRGGSGSLNERKTHVDTSRVGRKTSNDNDDDDDEEDDEDRSIAKFPRSVPTRWIDPAATAALRRPTYFLAALQCCTPRRRSAFAGEP